MSSQSHAGAHGGWGALTVTVQSELRRLSTATSCRNSFFELAATSSASGRCRPVPTIHCAMGPAEKLCRRMRHIAQ